MKKYLHIRRFVRLFCPHIPTNIGYQKCYGKKYVAERLLHTESIYHYCNFNICKYCGNYRNTVKSCFTEN